MKLSFSPEDERFRQQAIEMLPRAFDVASLLRDRREALAADPEAAARMRRRLDLFSARLGLDRERVRGWGIAHALAWGFEGDRALPGHVECARLLMG